MSFLADLEAAAAELSRLNPPKPKRYNPRPPGVPRPGSASDDVLQFLRSSPGLRTETQILMRVRRSRSAVAWALLWLRQVGLIEGVPDPKRNARYLRYRAAPKKGESDAQP